jgi:hypothetical protein
MWVALIILSVMALACAGGSAETGADPVPESPWAFLVRATEGQRARFWALYGDPFETYVSIKKTNVAHLGAMFPRTRGPPSFVSLISELIHVFGLKPLAALGAMGIMAVLHAMLITLLLSSIYCERSNEAHRNAIPVDSLHHHFLNWLLLAGPAS